jgi:predicted ATPase/class 3 adenylate cyclase
VAAEVDGDTIEVDGSQRRRLLAVLTSRVGRRVSLDTIVDALWGERIPASAVKAVRSHVARLRQSLGPCESVVKTIPGGYTLDLDENSVDAMRFARLAADGGRELAVGNERAAKQLLSEAVALWRGPAYVEFAGESWASGISVWLDECRATAVEDLGEALLRLGRAAEAITLLERHIDEHERRERPVALLMQALADDGRTTEALQAVRRFRTRLSKEIGIEPTPVLTAVEATLTGALDADASDRAATNNNGLPTGTLTFLLTDIEGSTELWQRDEAAMSDALAAHDSVLQALVDAHGGHVIKHTGDGICAVFTSARAAASAALEAQRQLELPVRMGLDTGDAELRAGDYYGTTLNRASRVMSAGHGGQILLSPACAALVAELDLIDLGEHVLRDIATPIRLFQLGEGQFEALRTADHPAGNLPAELTSFVGREAEIDHIARLLTDHRLVTLVGPGGTGKTRLAIAATTAAAPQFSGGCWLVDLAPVSVDESVATAFATGLGFRAAIEGDVLAAVTTRLREKQVLVVVDSCEHVTGATAIAVERIVRTCPNVVILATSREPLMFRGEQLVPVAPLPVHDARKLFIQRAKSEAPELDLDERQLAAVDELCQRLDGLPLAIELAASRVRAFSPVDLAASIDERFRLLIGGRHRIGRHQTLRSTIDWSYERCDVNEQLVFDRVASFQSSFSLPAACAVAVDDDLHDYEVVDAISGLVDRSMLQHLTGPGGGSRYRLLETMRAYGREHLAQRGETEAARRRHALAVAEMMTALALSTLGPSEQTARDEITTLVADCRAALEWFIDNRDWDGAVRVVTFGVSNSRREEQELIDRLVHAITEAGDSPTVLAELRSTEQEFTLPPAEWNELALEGIRSEWRPASDRFSYPPHYYLESSPTTDPISTIARDALVDSASAFDAAPLPVRALTEWWVIRALVMHGATASAHDRLSVLEDITERLHSSTARSYVCEIRGQLASAEGAWSASAQWFTEALALSPTDHGGLFEIVTAWHRLRAVAMSGQDIVSSELLAPWLWLRECNELSLREFGACTSAFVLNRLGFHDLAQRFWWWAAQNAKDDLADETARFPIDSAAFGHPPTSRSTSTDFSRSFRPSRSTQPEPPSDPLAYQA